MSGGDSVRDLLREITAPSPPPFALIRRGKDVEVMVGEMESVGRIADIPLPGPGPGDGEEHGDVLALVPYRQLAERGYDCVDDGTPLAVLRIRDQGRLSAAEAAEAVPDTAFTIEHAGFDVGDEEYARVVREVLDKEIGNGGGANFVIRRDHTARIPGYTPAVGLAVFRRLLERESGAQWTFVVHTGERTLVGASPERHVVLREGTAVMNPISGTYRYPPSGPRLEEVLGFLSDEKETEELYMVLDEELKPQPADPPSEIDTLVARIAENCEPALSTVLFMGGAGGSLRAGVTENPVRLTMSVKDKLTRVTCGGAPAYVWPGGGITVMVDVARMPDKSTGYVPTPALVFPIEFTMRQEDYRLMGGHVQHIVPVEQVLAEQRKKAVMPHAENPWPMNLPEGSGR